MIRPGLVPILFIFFLFLTKAGAQPYYQLSEETQKNPISDISNYRKYSIFMFSIINVYESKSPLPGLSHIFFAA